jgi:hypothetical protein
MHVHKYLHKENSYIWLRLQSSTQNFETVERRKDKEEKRNENWIKLGYGSL